MMSYDEPSPEDPSREQIEKMALALGVSRREAHRALVAARDVLLGEEAVELMRAKWVERADQNIADSPEGHCRALLNAVLTRTA